MFVYFKGFYDNYTLIGGENITTKRNNEINEIATTAPIPMKKKIGKCSY